mmetsp:Transcript_47279/g.148539  ORF Transcript_47279/g.148539 Transcript_47279/m.148539 type:complete len:326 (+) Transcript_47279:182-1159(+)
MHLADCLSEQLPPGLQAPLRGCLRVCVAGQNVVRLVLSPASIGSRILGGRGREHLVLERAATHQELRPPDAPAVVGEDQARRPDDEPRAGVLVTAALRLAGPAFPAVAPPEAELCPVQQHGQKHFDQDGDERRYDERPLHGLLEKPPAVVSVQPPADAQQRAPAQHRGAGKVRAVDAVARDPLLRRGHAGEVGGQARHGRLVLPLRHEDHRQDAEGAQLADGLQRYEGDEPEHPPGLLELEVPDPQQEVRDRRSRLRQEGKEDRLQDARADRYKPPKEPPLFLGVAAAKVDAVPPLVGDVELEPEDKREEEHRSAEQEQHGGNAN